MSKQFRRLRDTGAKATTVAAILALTLVGAVVPTVAQATDSSPVAVEASESAPAEESIEASEAVTEAAAEIPAEDIVPVAEDAPAEQPAAESDTETAAESAAPVAAPQAPVAAADAPVVQAAGVAGSATGLALTVLRDGTANNDGSWDADDVPGNDSSETNGIVRTHDSVVYRWGFSVAAAGDVTLTQTLPEGMSWVVAESTAACAEGASGVSSDGRTLTCTRADQATGAATYQVRAMVDSGANGEVKSTVLSSAGATDSAPAEVTVSATPKINIQTTIGTNGYTVFNGEGGQMAALYPSLYVPIDSNRGLKGLEPLSDEFTFVIDASDMGANVQPSACSANGGSYNFGTSLTSGPPAVSSVTDAGTWSCSQPAPGEPITVTVRGANTDASHYPTVTGNSGAMPEGRAFVTIGSIQLWIPQSDYPEQRTTTVQIVDFDPDSRSGQSNYGDGYAPGYAPGSALVNGTNGGSFIFTVGGGSSLGMGRVYSTVSNPSWTNPVPEGATSVTSGDAPMYPGTTLRFGGYAGPKTSDGSAMTNFSLCAVWDESTMTGGSVVTGGSQPNKLEYGHIDGLTSEAQYRAVDCGLPGDGASGWSTTKEGVEGGAAAVNAVRYSWDTVANNVTPYTAIELTRTDKVLASGTPLPVFFQARGDGLNLVRSAFYPQTQTNGSMGARALAASAETSVEVSWDGATSDPGMVRTVTVQPVASTPTGADGVAQNASVDVTIPSGVSMIANSWPAANAPTNQVTNGNGSITYTFPLGDLNANELVDTLTFQVGIGTRIEMPATLTITAVISADGDSRAASYRTDTTDLIVNSPAAFSANKLASTSVAVPGTPMTYTVSWMNGLSSTVGVGKIVDVLPFTGDGRGTTGLEGMTLDAVTVTADMTVETQYTTDASAAVIAAVNADRSGDTGVAWSTLAPGATPPANTTALRFVTADIDPGTSGEAVITVTPVRSPPPVWSSTTCPARSSWSPSRSRTSPRWSCPPVR